MFIDQQEAIQDIANKISKNLLKAPSFAEENERLKFVVHEITAKLASLSEELTLE